MLAIHIVSLFNKSTQNMCKSINWSKLLFTILDMDFFSSHYVVHDNFGNYIISFRDFQIFLKQISNKYGKIFGCMNNNIKNEI